MTGGLNGKTGETLRWVIGLILVALVSYFTSKGTVDTRLSVAETKIESMGRDLDRIEKKVDRILEAVR